MKDSIGLIPPQAVDLEESILGAIMLERDAIDKINTLRAIHFYKPSHQTIFEAIQSLNFENAPIDILTVTERLRKKKKLDEVGGPYSIVQLTSKVASAHHIEYHSEIVKQKYLQRELIRIASEIQKRAYDNNADIDEIMDFANISFDLATNEVFADSTALSWPDLLRKTLDSYKEREIKQREGKSYGIATPVQDLTKCTGGWQKGELVVVAARPAMGKTAFCLSLVVTAAQSGEKPCLFSLEMQDTGLAGRIMVGESGVSADNFKSGKLDFNEWGMLEKTIANLYNLGIIIDDYAGATMQYVKNRAKLLKKKGQCTMVLIDYLQLCNSDKKTKMREQEVAEMSRNAKLMAKELDMPVILLSQLSREVEKRSDKRPQLSDLRESGAIEQDADIVLFLYRPEYYGFQTDENGASNEGKGEIIVSKNRNGHTGTIDFWYNKSLTKIYDYNSYQEQTAF